MTHLNEKALEAARTKFANVAERITSFYALEPAIQVYLSALGEGGESEELAKSNATLQYVSVTLGGTDEWTEQDSMIADIKMLADDVAKRLAQPLVTEAMVERAARAMCAADAKRVEGGTPMDWETISANHRETFMILARAGLQAAHNVTPEGASNE